MEIAQFAQCLFLSTQQQLEDGKKASKMILSFLENNPLAFLQLSLTLFQNPNIIPQNFDKVPIISMALILCRQIYKKFSQNNIEKSEILLQTIDPIVAIMEPLLSSDCQKIRQQAATLFGQVSIYVLLHNPGISILSTLLQKITSNQNELFTLSVCTAINLILQDDIFRNEENETFMVQLSQIASSIFPLLSRENISNSIKSSLIEILTTIVPYLDKIITREYIPQFLSSMVSWTTTPSLSSSCWLFWDELYIYKLFPFIIGAPNLIQIAIQQLSYFFQQQQENSKNFNPNTVFPLFYFLMDIFDDSEDPESPFRAITQPIVISIIPILFSYMASSNCSIESIEDENSTSDGALSLFTSISDVYPQPCIEAEQQFLTQNASSENKGSRLTALICLYELSLTIPKEMYPNVFPSGLTLINQRLQESLQDNPGIIYWALKCLSSISIRYQENYQPFLPAIFHYIANHPDIEEKMSCSLKIVMESARDAIESVVTAQSCTTLIPDIIRSLIEMRSESSLSAIRTIIKKSMNTGLSRKINIPNEYCTQFYEPFLAIGSEISQNNINNPLIPHILDILSILLKKTGINAFVEKIGWLSFQIFDRSKIPEALKLLISVCEVFGEKNNAFIGHTIQIMIMEINNVVNTTSSEFGYDPTLLKIAIKGLRKQGGIQSQFGIPSKIDKFISSLIKCEESSILRFSAKIEGIRAFEFFANKYPALIQNQIQQMLFVSIIQRMSLTQEGYIVREKAEDALEMASAILGLFINTLKNRLVISNEEKQKLMEESLETIKILINLPIQTRPSFEKVLTFLGMLFEIEVYRKKIQEMVQSEAGNDYIFDGAQSSPQTVLDFYRKIGVQPSEELQKIIASLA